MLRPLSFVDYPDHNTHLCTISISTWQQFQSQFSHEVNFLQAITTSADGMDAADVPAIQFTTLEGLGCRKYSIKKKLTEFILSALNRVQFEPVGTVK